MAGPRTTGFNFLGDWYYKLSAVYATLLAIIWIRCLSDYWWETTFTIVHSLLVSSVLIMIVIPWKKISVGLQLMAIIIINGIYTDFHWIPATSEIDTWAEWRQWGSLHMEQLTPYIWISLGVWLAVQAAVMLRTKRTAIILLVSAALLSLAVADSLLTPIYLWEEIAGIVFVGLGWLVASHFANFKQKHPDSWRHLLEYPLSLFLPVLLIIALVMGAGLFVPSIDPILKDPYTVWKESRGEAVPSYIGSKIGTETVAPKNAGDSRSGYSRNDESLGNGFTFDYSPVMTVTTTRRSYWRGETKALYNGAGWEDSRVELREEAVTSISPNEALPLGTDRASVETVQVEQTFTMIRKDRYPVLFGAGPISSIVYMGAVDQPFPSMRWLPQSWELRLPRGESADYPETYSIVSDTAVLDEAALRNITVSGTGDSLNSIYLQLPDELPERVRTLAADITAEAGTPYDKVKAIESYLQTNFKYNNQPDLSARSSNDFVDAFLFEMQEGYCDYFSTSMAVLTRSIGIPARWVKGYSPGSLPMDAEFSRPQGPGGMEINPDGAGTYTVRNADAHSWVEVYFEGYGWLPFEPTAGFSFPYAMPSDEPVAVPEIESDTAPTKTEVEEKGFTIPGWTIAAAIVVLLGVVAAFRYRSIRAAWKQYRDRARTANERIVKETERLIKHCRRKGLDRAEHETVRETMSRWSGRLTFLQTDFRAIQLTFEKAMYSSQPITEDEIARFESHVRSVRERLT
ncbi:DUF4129 domain-containing transglutaminase family protein [Paenibacillus mendelii]|uniref:DUF4129 domain-containing transglutaminase family protein n=1 Tax=Paenibacillus mendelii TaxID=206163 RepID=A0ABV6JHW6_9BACL|nr:transglutaminase domain-containing protein [Paenibacillus mendelii]MCQ6558388.1 transglutaminase domain-containing protein [Paenibacillus mendelii]